MALTRRSFCLVALALTVCCALSTPSTPARADDTPVTLGISPAIAEIAITNGAVVRRQLTVTNQANTAVAVRAYVENFEPSGPDGAISFNTDTTKQYASSTWIKLKDPNLILNPHQQVSLDFTIDCPPDAEPGGHYSTIFLEPVSVAQPNTNSKLGISQRVGALLFITVGGNNVEQGRVLGASTTGGCSGLACSFKTAAFREWGPVPFAFQFENTGNIHVKVSGSIVIKDLFGRQIGEVPIGEKTVLPGSSRNFTVTWLREVLLGRYTAKLTLDYGAQHRTETATVTFWVFPWRAVAVLIGLMLTGLTAGVIIRRKRRPITKELSN